jgi:heterodisulfide reductase subunit A
VAQKEEIRIGVFVCECGFNIAGSVDCDELTEWSRSLPGVVFSIKNRYTCAEPGQQEIIQYVKEENLNRVVVASCTPRMHGPTFRKCCADAGLNPYLFEMANIREHCSWVHMENRKLATEKAKDLVKMAVARARLLEPQIELEVPVTKAALVIGGGIAGIQASLDLAESGYQVYLVEKEPSIGGIMAQLNKTYPTMD